MEEDRTDIFMLVTGEFLVHFSFRTPLIIPDHLENAKEPGSAKTRTRVQADEGIEIDDVELGDAEFLHLTPDGRRPILPHVPESHLPAEIRLFLPRRDGFAESVTGRIEMTLSDQVPGAFVCVPGALDDLTRCFCFLEALLHNVPDIIAGEGIEYRPITLTSPEYSAEPVTETHGISSVVGAVCSVTARFLNSR